MRFVLLAFVLVFGFRPVSAATTTPDAFIAAIKSAIAAKSTDQLLALTCTTGMSDADKKQTASIDQMVLFDTAVTEITLVPLPADFQTVYIANGKKLEPTAQPQGLVQIQFAKKPGGGQTSTSIGYGVIGGAYYLLSTKTTDLGWKGPPDKTLSFMVMGQGANSRVSVLKVDVKWNASGVEQERTFKTPSTGFLGQYFESVTVTSSEPGDLSLELMENGKDIVPPIKGNGIVTYKK